MISRSALGRLHPPFMDRPGLYRVVKEYDGDRLTAKRTRSSKRPLSLGELIEFFRAAWPLEDILEMNEPARQQAQAVTQPSSLIGCCITPSPSTCAATRIDSRRSSKPEYFDTVMTTHHNRVGRFDYHTGEN
jgi:hypothetical protein